MLLAGCGAQTAEESKPTETELPSAAAEEEEEVTDMIKLTIGDNVIYASLADTTAADELAELLQNGPVSMSASNYGGFEKVCALGSRLSTSDVQTTTAAGDIMLYSGRNIVIFYGSNSWAYTRLGKVHEEYIPSLRAILSGSEDEVIIELAENAR